MWCWRMWCWLQPGDDLPSLVAALVQDGSIPLGWTLLDDPRDIDDSAVFCVHSSGTADPTRPPTVVRSVTIHSDLNWHAHVLGKVVPRVNDTIQSLPSTITDTKKLSHVLQTVQSAAICIGNPETQFVELLERKGGKSTDRDGSPNAFIDSQCSLGDSIKTVRKQSCHLLCRHQRCPECNKYRRQLQVERTRERKRSVSSRTRHDSHCTYRSLDSSEKEARLRNLAKAVRIERQRSKAMIEKLTKELDDNAVTLTEQDSADMTALVTDREVNNQVAAFPEGSIQKLFWEQQVHHHRLSNKKQMRWHPLMIRFALNLKYSSTAAYRAVQRSGFIALPSERTLRDYTHWTKIVDGP